MAPNALRDAEGVVMPAGVVDDQLRQQAQRDRLCAEHLSLGAVRGVAAAESPGLESHIPGDADSREWVSDGGLGAVFQSAGLPVPLREGVR